MGVERKTAFRVALLCLVMAMVLSGCFSGSGPKEAENDAVKDANNQAEQTQGYKPGTYEVSAKGNNGDVKLAVTFSEDKIEKIEIVEQHETEGLGDVALQKVAEEILEAQHLNVDAVSGASIASKAVIDAVAAAVDEAGGNSGALLTAAKEEKQGVDEEITTDIAIVGGGASGTAAALAALEKGKKVVVIEKGDSVGGAGRYLAEGLLAFESDQQKAAGHKETVEEAFQYLNNYTHYLNNGNLTREILEQSGSTISWLAGYGVDTQLIANTQEAHADIPTTYHKYVDRTKAYENMYQHLTDMGGTYYTNTTGKELIVDGGGAVTGVISEKKDGGKLTVNAKSVILATGGYAGSDEMLRKYLNVTDYSTMAYANNKGDGIKMALNAGADEFNIGTVAVHSASIPSKDPEIWQGSAGTLLNLPLMWINREGKRFADEGVVYDYALMGNALLAQGGEIFVVLDDATMKELSEQGSDLPNSFERTFMIAAGVDTALATGKVAPIADLYEAVEKAIGAGVAFKADTLEDLAKALDVDAANLTEAAKLYNQAVKDGKDTQFLKDSKFLKYGVEKGPFYAIKAHPTVEDSIGGLRVNSSLQVLTEQLKPIAGLYAVGCDAGGLFGDSYPVYEGLSLSFAFNSGRLAGYSAAEDIQ